MIGALGGAAILGAAFRGERSWRSAKTPHSSRPILYREGIQIVAIFVGSETCTASLKRGFAETIHRMRSDVQVQAQKQGKQFSYMGLSAGNSAQAGILYLAPFGPFDEISSGHGWLNNEAMHFIWQQHPGEAAVPQVIVIQRRLAMLQPGYAFSDEKVLLRAVGVPQIENWVRGGSPIG